MPKLFLKYIGFYELSYPLYSSLASERNGGSIKESISSMRNKTFQHPLTMPFEMTMKLIFSSVIFDEVFIHTVDNMDNIPESKDKTMFNQKLNVINDIMGYKRRPPVSASTDRFESEYMNSNHSKKSVNSNA